MAGHGSAGFGTLRSMRREQEIKHHKLTKGTARRILHFALPFLLNIGHMQECHLALYRTMLLIRRSEEQMARAHAMGLIPGPESPPNPAP